MKFVFQNDTAFNRIVNIVSDTWMCLERGEGEEEIANHGRSRVKSFSQETGAIGQQAPRIGEHEPKLHSKSQVQDAHDSPTQLPFFSLPLKFAACEEGGTLQRVAASDSPRAAKFFLASVGASLFSSEFYCRSFLVLWNLRQLFAESHLPHKTKFVREAKGNFAANAQFSFGGCS